MQLIGELKLALRERRMSYRDVARALRLSEASVKRLFSRGGFTLARIDAICAALGMELTDIVERMRQRTLPDSRLTREQEQEIVADPKLFLLTWLVLNRWSVDAVRHTFEFSERELQRLLIRLDRLKLIELQPGNRSRLLVPDTVGWLPGGPIQRYVQNIMLREYFNSDFTHRYADFKLHGTTYSEGAIIRVRRLLQNCLRDCMAISAEEAQLPQEQRYGAAIVLAVRPWQFSGFSRFLRKIPKLPP
jgi:DNA-binding Xre family transcriptional regulator